MLREKEVMRKELQLLGSDMRYTFTANYGAVGYKRSYDSSGTVHYQPTIMLKDVKIKDKIVTDHLWFNYTKGFAKLQELHGGDVIQFDGRISSYTKGTIFIGYKVDYKIERPTKIKLLNREPVFGTLPDPVEDKNALVGYIMKTNKNFYLENGRPYDSWYVDEYNIWHGRIEGYKRLSDSDKYKLLLHDVNSFLQENDTRQLNKFIIDFHEAIDDLQEIVKKRDYVAIQQKLQYCQNKYKVISTKLKQAKRYINYNRLSQFDDLQNKNEIYQRLINTYHDSWHQVSNCVKFKNMFTVRQFKDGFTEFNEVLLQLENIEHILFVTDIDLNDRFRKFTQNKMHFKYLPDKQEQEKLKYKYKELRREVASFRKSDLTDEVNVNALNKKIDEYENFSKQAKARILLYQKQGLQKDMAFSRYNELKETIKNAEKFLKNEIEIDSSVYYQIEKLIEQGQILLDDCTTDFAKMRRKTDLYRQNKTLSRLVKRVRKQLVYRKNHERIKPPITR